MKIRAVIFLLWGMTNLLNPGLLAQENTEQVAEKMKSFSWMEGQWRGEAWYIGADRTKAYLIQEEIVEASIDSEVLANGDGSYSWFIDLPYGKTRYTLRQSDEGFWNEKGEFSLDGGENWMQTFEINIQIIC
jgi:hypothetical protein